jgi:hypothetical protein
MGLEQELEELSRLKASLKKRCMVFQVEAKEDTALFLGMDFRALHLLSYADWSLVYAEFLVFIREAERILPLRKKNKEWKTCGDMWKEWAVLCPEAIAPLKEKVRAILKREGKRKLDSNGRPYDRGFVLPGDRFLTVSGNETTPFPPKKERERGASLWLIQNTTTEAAHRNDSFAETVFRQATLLKKGELTPADKASMLEYLFDE